MVTVGFTRDNIRNYKRLSYEWWYAIAELVDNSTQSYFNNRDSVDAALFESDDLFEVSVNYNSEEQTLTITDNSVGMTEDELDQAMNIGQPPSDPDGRCKFGLGMKTACCWVGNEWKVTTSKLGSDKKTTITFNVEDVASGLEELPTEIDDEDEDEHYTIVEISDLNKSLANRTIGKIKKYLTSIYREDLKDGTMRLVYKDESLEWDLFNDEDFLEDSEGEIYKKELNPVDIDEKEVTGWIGILDPGDRANAGFALIQNNRVIETQWRPEENFGDNTGNLISQRLAGELHLSNAFDVSHTKDKINWNGDEERQLINQIEEQYSDYITRAKTSHTSLELDGPSPATVSTAVSNVKTVLESDELVSILDESSISILGQTPENLELQELAISAANTEAEAILEIHFPMLDLTVRVKWSEISTADPYFTQDTEDPTLVVVNVNKIHDYFMTLHPSDVKSVEQYILQAMFDAMAQKIASTQSRVDHMTISRLKDAYLRAPYRVENSTLSEDEDE